MRGACNLDLNSSFEEKMLLEQAQPLQTKKIIKNDLMLYYKNECNQINETPIEIDDGLCFSLKNNDSSAKFKSIISLLEFYISDRLVLNLIYILLFLFFWFK